MKTKIYLLLSCLIWFASCSTSSENSKVEINKYFSLKRFFSAQAQMLQNNKTQLNKIIVKDGKQEEKKFSSINWNQELNPFIECDINKPAYVNSYIIDTVYLPDGMQLKYVAKDKGLPVRQILLLFRSNKVYQIAINKKSSNSYYRAENKYVFNSGIGFAIEGSQDVVLAHKTNYSITASFK